MTRPLPISMPTAAIAAVLVLVQLFDVPAPAMSRGLRTWLASASVPPMRWCRPSVLRLGI